MFSARLSLGATLSVTAAACAMAVLPGAAFASLEHPGVVNEDPADYTPRLVDDGSGPKSRVDAADQASIAGVGDVLYAGGLFDTVQDSAGVTYPRTNLYAFEADDGTMSGTFAPVVDGNVFAVGGTPNAVHIGGMFATVDGVARPALAKRGPVTGQVDQQFNARFVGGKVEDIELVGSRLIVGGSAGKNKLSALNPATGANTGFIDLGIADPIPGARGGVTVFDFAVSPDGSQWWPLATSGPSPASPGPGCSSPTLLVARPR